MHIVRPSGQPLGEVQTEIQPQILNMNDKKEDDEYLMQVDGRFQTVKAPKRIGYKRYPLGNRPTTSDNKYI